MDKQKLDLFLDRLLEKTNAEELEWQTTVSKDTFLVALQDTAISITKKSVDRYSFDFRNDMGDIVESVVVSEAEGATAGFRSGKFDKAGKIFELAKKQSLKTNETVDRILEQLAA